MKRLTLYALLAGVLISGASGQQPKPASIIWNCDKAFMFGFGSWEKAWKDSSRETKWWPLPPSPSRPM